MVDPLSVDGPNLARNDSAFCYQLPSKLYRDFRTTLQLASVLFPRATSVAPWPLG